MRERERKLKGELGNKERNEKKSKEVKQKSTKSKTAPIDQTVD